MIELFKVYMASTVADNLIPVLNSGYITQGKKVEEFENKLQEFFDFPRILTLNSATSGLTLALRLCTQVGVDYYEDTRITVLTTPKSCLATNFPILANNMDIKWVDTDPKTGNMDLDDLERKLAYDTTIIMVVHWGGNPIDLNRLEQIRLRGEQKFGHSIRVIEDCAHAFGAVYGDRMVGTHGNICVFSLQAIKHLTTGDGGLIFLPNDELYERAKLLRWYGVDRNVRSGKSSDFRLEGDVKEWGYKFHMNDVNATIGLSNLPFIQGNLDHARMIVGYYETELSKLPWIKLIKVDPMSKSSYWIFTMRIQQRDRFIEWMKERSVVTSQVHQRNDIHSCLSEYKTKLPQLDVIEKDLVCIPCGWWVSMKDTEYVVKCVREFCLEYIRVIELEADKVEEYVNLLFQLNSYRVPEDVDVMEKYQDVKRCGGKIFLMYLGDELVASAKRWLEPKFSGNGVMHIEDVVVDSKFRHQGIGGMMVEFMKRSAIQEGCYKILLNARDDLRGFYTGCDFKDEGTQMVFRKQN
jgi:dTDP-4-amino-4,6-dideoxygalactose transaminase